MRWYVEPAFAQQRDFNSRVLRALDELSERIDARQRELAETTARDSDDLCGTRSPAVERSLTELDERAPRRAASTPPARPAASANRRTPLPRSARSPDYFAFESRMRGSSELIRERQAAYLDEFRDAAPVLDIGCGRGEFLSLLREAGVEARGIDTNPDMVAHCQDEGWPSSRPTRSATCSGLEDGSLGGIFCAHVLEHLDPAALFQLLELAVAKLRPGGCSSPRRRTRSASSPSPTSPPTCRTTQPLHPADAVVPRRQAGFRDVTLRFMSEPAEDERLGSCRCPKSRPSRRRGRRSTPTSTG